MMPSSPIILGRVISLSWYRCTCTYTHATKITWITTHYKLSMLMINNYSYQYIPWHAHDCHINNIIIIIIPCGGYTHTTT